MSSCYDCNINVPSYGRSDFPSHPNTQTQALRVLTRLECPRPPAMDRRDYEAWLDRLVTSKFNYVVSAQVYGKNRTARDARCGAAIKSAISFAMIMKC